MAIITKMIMITITIQAKPENLVIDSSLKSATRRNILQWKLATLHYQHGRNALHGKLSKLS